MNNNINSYFDQYVFTITNKYDPFWESTVKDMSHIVNEWYLKQNKNKSDILNGYLSLKNKSKQEVFEFLISKGVNLNYPNRTLDSFLSIFLKKVQDINTESLSDNDVNSYFDQYVFTIANKYDPFWESTVRDMSHIVNEWYLKQNKNKSDILNGYLSLKNKSKQEVFEFLISKGVNLNYPNRTLDSFIEIFSRKIQNINIKSVQCQCGKITKFNVTHMSANTTFNFVCKQCGTQNQVKV